MESTRVRLFRCRILADFLRVFAVAVMLGGCVSAPGNSSYYIGTPYSKPKGEVETLRGVINGLHRYDPQKTRDMMTEFDEHLSVEEVRELSGRYIVKVGIDRQPLIAVLSPLVIGSQWSGYVVLPEGWTYSVTEISSNPGVINVGDVVDIAFQSGRRYDFVTGLVRKCFEEPLDDENPDWDIGCKVYEGFGDEDFVGEYYRFRQF